MNPEGKSLFPDEEPAPIPKKPQGVQPMGKVHNRIALISSGLAAGAIWWLIHNTIQEEPRKGLHSMQIKASDNGKPITHTSQETVSDRVKEVLTGEKETPITTTINPIGQDPAFQITTSEATITGNEEGKIEKIIPKESATEPLPTPKEAQSTVDEALKDAAKKTLPKEEKSILPPPIKID